MEEKDKTINEVDTSSAEKVEANAAEATSENTELNNNGPKEDFSKTQSEEPANEDHVKESKGMFGKKKKTTKKDKEKEALEQMGQKLAEINDKHIRLAAEFDNYRKRTLKEKSDLLKYGAESTLKNMLPVIDDFERALKLIESTPDEDPVKSGILLIYNKFREYLVRQGIKEIECKNCEFNVDEHEAITRFPAPSDELKGKIIDVVEKGYYYHDKVIRFAKVVIGE